MPRFAVDEVEPAKEALPSQPLRALYPDAIAIGGDPELRVIAHGEVHPLLAAVGRAFADHRPLVLTPDAVWLTIAQGVAQHVRLNAERLRGRLVRHDGRKRLTLATSGVPQNPTEWAAAVNGFRALLAEEVGDGRARLFECNFSTSSDVDRIASQVVLLDAYSPYFSYMMVAVCGIPSITVTGTVDDWTAMRERIEIISELDLEHWCRSLRPIADQFVRAATGDVDVAFWRRIYNPVDAYGGDLITGWVTRLYPYVEVQGALNHPNPMLELPIDEPKQRTTKTNRAYNGPGLRSASIPATVSRANVRIVDQVEQTHRSIDLIAGVVAVAQDSDGALRPIAGWRVENVTLRIEDVVERIKKDHAFEAAGKRDERRPIHGSAEVLAFYSQLERATLFAGDRKWNIRAPRERSFVGIERAGQYMIECVADLPDDKSLCVASEHRTGKEYWLVCRIEESKPEPDGIASMWPPRAVAMDLPSEIVVLAGSFAAILDAAMDSGGDIASLEVARFDSMLRSG
jgi:hypothetical protein